MLHFHWLRSWLRAGNFRYSQPSRTKRKRKEAKTNATNPAAIYLLKVNNRNTRTRCEICSKLTIKIPERRQWPPICISLEFKQFSFSLICFRNIRVINLTITLFSISTGNTALAHHTDTASSVSTWTYGHWVRDLDLHLNFVPAHKCHLPLNLETPLTNLSVLLPPNIFYPHYAKLVFQLWNTTNIYFH